MTDKPRDHATRLDLIEFQVEELKGVTAKTLAAVEGVQKSLASYRPPTSFRDMAYAIGATITIYTGFMALANGWFDSRLAPERIAITRMERQADDLPVLKYRLSLIEQKIKSDVTR